MSHLNPSLTKVGDFVDAGDCMALAYDEYELVTAHLLAASGGAASFVALLKLKKHVTFTRGYSRAMLDSKSGIREIAKSTVPNQMLMSVVIDSNLLHNVMEDHPTYIPVEWGQAPIEDENAMLVLYNRLSLILDIGILPRWTREIAMKGEENGLFSSLTHVFNCNVWRVENNVQKWQSMIVDLIKSGILEVE